MAWSVPKKNKGARMALRLRVSLGFDIRDPGGRFLSKILGRRVRQGRKLSGTDKARG